MSDSLDMLISCLLADEICQGCDSHRRVQNPDAEDHAERRRCVPNPGEGFACQRGLSERKDSSDAAVLTVRERPAERKDLSDAAVLTVYLGTRLARHRALLGQRCQETIPLFLKRRPMMRLSE